MKNHLLIIALLTTTICTHAQIVNIPDPNLKSTLIFHGVLDANKDGEIQVSEAENVTFLSLSNGLIEDLTGIEAFTSLTHLDCRENKLKKLDLSSNKLLKKIYCQSNKLEELIIASDTVLIELNCARNNLSKLDLRKNTHLDYLTCSDNPLKTLDLSKNVELTQLFCNDNQLVTIDLTNNIKLSNLLCYQNELTNLDVSKNIRLWHLSCWGNPSLSTICINDYQLSDTVTWYKNTTTKWSTTCVTGLDNQLLPNQDKEVSKIFNILGQELQPSQSINGLFINLYSDGKKRKIAK